MLFIGKPKGRSKMISNIYVAECIAVCVGVCDFNERCNVRRSVVLCGTTNSFDVFDMI